MRCLLPFVTAACLAAGTAIAQEPGAVAKVIVAASNDFRAAEGRTRLATDARLAAAAQAYAEFMARHDRLDHAADGRNPGERARLKGYAACAFAENIAYEYKSSGFAARDLAEALVRDWIESAGHRRNLLGTAYVHLGIGVAQSRRTSRWYAVQLFGRPCR